MTHCDRPFVRRLARACAHWGTSGGRPEGRTITHSDPRERAHYPTTYDPIVLAHAQALLTGTFEGATAYIDADARHTRTILDQAAATLDFAHPVAIMLVAILHCVSDEDDPRRIVATLRDAVPPGSYLVISHPTKDMEPAEMTEVASRLNRVMPNKVTYRSYDEVLRYFDGWELQEPGLVPTALWRPRHAPSIEPRAMWAGVAKKP